MLSKLGIKNLNIVLKRQNIKAEGRSQKARPTLGIKVISGSTLEGMRVRLRKLLKRRRHDTEQPRAKPWVWWR